jgi:uncharacterized LabA/DUF88 family protein
MEHSRETIAMLIDADNSPSDKIDFILAELAKYGVVNIRRAYGNWKSRSLKGWEDKLHDYAIRPIQQFDYTKGKNATDMAMTIDGMDLLYGSKLDAFCIVSSDSDFTPLVMRILSEGLNVYGFGQKSTPSPFVNACSTFLYLESIGSKEKTKSGDGSRRMSCQEMKSDSKLMTLLKNAVDSAQGEDGWSNLAKIGKNIANQASFDPRNYGFKRLSDLVRSIDIFEFEFRNKNSELYIRDKAKARRHDQPGGHQPESAHPHSHAQDHTHSHQHQPAPVPPAPIEEFPLPEHAEPASLKELAMAALLSAQTAAAQSAAEPAPAGDVPAVKPKRTRRPAVKSPKVLPAAAGEEPSAKPAPAPAEPSAVEPAAEAAAEPAERPKRKPRRPARKKSDPEGTGLISEPAPPAGE